MPPIPKVEPPASVPKPLATGRVLQLANPHLLGDDVKEAQKLLKTNPFGDFQPGDVDGEFGELTAGAVHRAKWELGYPANRVNSAFGPKLKAYLQGQTPLPASYKKERERRLKESKDETKIRERIVDWADWGVAHTDQISYDQNGPRLAGLDKPGLLPLVTDCSAFATIVYNWAGAPNPNGGRYDRRATAYTGTMLASCRKIPQSAVEPGDLVVWTPPGTGSHVCLVVSTGSNPLLVSHGSDRGPLKLRFSDEHAYQRAHGHGVVSWLTVF